MSNYNYCPVICYFCGEVNTTKMEKIQDEDYNSSYEILLKKSGLPSLKIRRLRTMAIEVFKILHKQAPSFLHDIVKFKNISYSFRKINTVEVPQVRTTNFGLNSFIYGGATFWNELPENIQKETSLEQFMQMWFLHILNLAYF